MGKWYIVKGFYEDIFGEWTKEFEIIVFCNDENEARDKAKKLLSDSCVDYFTTKSIELLDTTKSYSVKEGL